MIGTKKVACIIPARLQSTRFPKKMLKHLLGKPLLQWVWERANTVRIFDEIVFAIDTQEIADLIASFGAPYFMTSIHCASGTDRLVELFHRKAIDADIWVNWQGDEPFISSTMIDTLLTSCEKQESDIWTLKKKIVDEQEILSPHVAKVVCDQDGFALLFSRSMIPFYRDIQDKEKMIFYKHIGLYAFTKEALKKISHLKPCALECAEQLEQLRFLYYNLHIKVQETQEDVFGIDLPEHLTRAEALLQSVIWG